MGVPVRAAEQDRRGLAARASTGSSAATSTSSSTRPPASARAPTARRSAARPSRTAIPCLTTLAAGVSAARAIASARRDGEPRRAVPAGAARLCAPTRVADARERAGAPRRRRFGRRLLTVAGQRRAGRLPRAARRRSRRRPSRAPGQFAMLAAAERWGGGRGRAPVSCRAPSRSRAGARRVALPARGRRAGHAAPVRARGATGSGRSGRSARASRRPGRRPSRDPRRRRCRHRAAGDPPGCARGRGGTDATVLLGFRDGPRARGARAAARRARGHRRRLGRPPRPVDRAARRRSSTATRAPRSTPAARPAMLEAVRAMCATRDVPAQLALEAGMACGFGACFGCVVPRRGGGYLRVCVDGPVIDAAALERVEHAGAHAGRPPA